ncbi:ATP-binding protein [Streptomyces sp. NRRL F-5123]|uniref:ATP-binding protein n=1 Tax=Streptomyces sp. NRRL F-5123 TaxID=1463856 RepID=UPI0005B89F2A|nr:ATP-binding protein [Streptomyces sp. NRRL F-5123]
MAAVAPGLEILAELRAGNPATALSGIRQMLSLTVDREPLLRGAEVSEATAAWVPRLRRVARAKLTLWGLPSVVDSSLLLISELVTNGLRYGADQQIVFRMVLVGDFLVVEVEDGSPTRPSIRAADSDAESGRGLLLVDALADEWGVSKDGTRTWCAARIRAAGRS